MTITVYIAIAAMLSKHVKKNTEKVQFAVRAKTD